MPMFKKSEVSVVAAMQSRSAILVAAAIIFATLVAVWLFQLIPADGVFWARWEW